MKTDGEPSAYWRSGSFNRADGGSPRPLFGQVHEDAAVECLALRGAPSATHAVAIGSGGCTAFALLTEQPARLSIVDINPAQIWLIELKRAAFLRLSHGEMLDFCADDGRRAYELIRGDISPGARSYWDQHRQTLCFGLNQSGLAERNLRRAMVGFRLLVHGRARTELILSQIDPRRQRAIFEREWDTRRWRLIFRLILNPTVLRFVYGPPFVAALPKDFAARMNQQVNAAFLRWPTQANPYLWQTFLSRYANTDDEALPIYLRQSSFSGIRNGLTSRTNLYAVELTEWLAAQPDRSIGFFALSNVLEAAGVPFHERLFNQISRTAVPDAVVCLRAIFPSEHRLPERRFSLDSDLSRIAFETDRSLGCRNIEIYRARPR